MSRVFYSFSFLSHNLSNFFPASIYNQVLDTPEEREMYAKLKALNHHHRKIGVHAVLAKKLYEKRAKITEGMQQKIPFFIKCIFTEGGVKCGDRTLPATKYCRKHILEDKKQVLFRACGVEKSNIICQEPVPNVFEHSTCVLHINLPTQRLYVHKKYESTDDEDEQPLKKLKKEVKKEIKRETPKKEEVKTEEVVEQMEIVDNPFGDYSAQEIVETGDVNITIEHP